MGQTAPHTLVWSYHPNGKGDGKMLKPAKYSIMVYTTSYAAWEEGQDEPVKLRTDDELWVFDRLTEVVDFLRNAGLTEASESAPYSHRTWLSLSDGSQPHGRDALATGETESVTAHLEDGFTDREWFAVLASVTSR